MLFVLLACGSPSAETQPPAPVLVPVPTPVVVPVPAPPASAGDAGPCKAGEKAAFACTTKNGKNIAVCATADKAWYRFGPPGAPELEFPPDGDPKKLAIEHRNFVRSEQTVLVFENNGVAYEVTDAIGGGGGPDAESNNFQGVYVLENGKTIATISCSASPTIDWDAGAVIPRR